jgi:hypothetical protein
MWRNAKRLLRFPGRVERHCDDLGPSDLRGWLTKTVAMLFLATILIVCVDCLAVAVGADVPAYVNGWWGPSAVSHWGRVGLAKHQLTLAGRDLDIKIEGDTLTAIYTLTTPAKYTKAAAALIGTQGDAGDALVSHVLGSVSVGEFRYGPTGSIYVRVPLTFQRPQLDITARVPTVTVTSNPLRLFLQRQRISINDPVRVIRGGKDQVRVEATGIRVLTTSGATLSGGTESEADLHRDGRTVNMTISSGNNSGQGWLSGLRGIGGMTIPVADGLFSNLTGLFAYIVFLWALVFIRKNMRDSRLAVAARNAIFTVVVALAAVAFLAFMVELGRALFHGPNDQSGAAAAGPIGLLVAGAALVWPVACFRIGPIRRPKDDRSGICWPGSVWPGMPWGVLWDGALEPDGSRRAVFGFGANALILGGYWAALLLLANINPFTNLQVLALTGAVALLVPLLVSRLFGTSGLMPWLVSAGVLCVVLSATLVWPLLYYNGWVPNGHMTLVNGFGKWAFLTAAVLTVLGLCIMAFQIAKAKTAEGRLWPWVWTGGIAAVISVAVLPDAFANSKVADSHATGLTAVDLFGLFSELVAVLDWLVLALAVVVAMSLPATPDARPLARRIALPIGLMLLYWNDTWLYLPVTFTIGLIMLSKLVFPSSLATEPRHLRTPEQAIKDSLAAWRRAEFASEQRTALAASSADALRDHLVNNDKDKDKSRYDFDSLANAQNNLAEERDRSQGIARTCSTEAFDHRGNAPSVHDAVIGALIGTVLGIIPATITLLTSNPSPDTSGYLVLDFFGGTAWTLFFWSGLGWFIGYFLPLIRGRNGSEKALWLLIAGIGAALPVDAIWNDSNDWAQTLIANLELSVFLLFATVYLCDLMVLKTAKRRAADWISVQNWRFVITWSTAFLAAIVTAAITSLTTAASNQIVKQNNVPSSPSSSQNSASG